MKNSSDLTVKRFDVSTRKYHASAETALKNARSVDLGTSLPLLAADDRIGTVDAYTSQGVLGVEFELNASPVAAQLKAMLTSGKAIELGAEFDGNRLVAINVKTELPQQVKAEPVAEQTPIEAALAKASTPGYLSLTIKRSDVPTSKTYQAIAWKSGTLDRQGDEFDADTFDLSVLERHPLPLLLAHDHAKIAGSVIAAEVIDGDLIITFALADTPNGNEAKELIASESLNCVSVGFIFKDGVRELIEVSLVAVPAMPGAVITQRSVQTQSLPDDAPAAGDTSDGASTLEKSAMQTLPTPALHLKQQAPYSISKLLVGLTEPTFTDWGYERELSQETALKSGRSTSNVMIPYGAFTAKAAVPQDSSTAAAGTPPVDPGLSLARPANDPSLFTIGSGAMFLQSLLSQLQIPTHQAPAGAFFVPRMQGNVKPDWVARDAAVGMTNATFDSVESKPKTLGATVQINRSALIDCRPMMDALLTEQLRLAMGNALDTAALGKVSGASANGPAGMLSQSFDGGAITDLESVLAFLRSIENLTGKTPRLAMGPILRDYLTCHPANAALTEVSAITLLTQGAVVFNPKLDLVDPAKSYVLSGDFSSVCKQVLFGAGVSVEVNPYADSVYAKGAILLRALVDADFLVTDETRLGRAAFAVPAPKP